jgi:AcrR family transcriptional regulator
MMAVTESPVPTRGRPRSAEADQAIADATIALLEEEGYSSMTMQGVAARAGVSTATLYRRWPSKQDLVVGTIKALVPEPQEIDTGTLAGDLDRFLNRVAQKLASDEGQLIKGIIGEAVRNPALAQAFREGFDKPPQPTIAGILGRAAARGEIPRPADVGLASALVVGVMKERWLLGNEPVTPAEIKLLVPMLVRAFGGTA